MMKIRLPIRPLSCNTTANRNISSNALHSRHNTSILIRKTHLSRCKIWVIATQSTRQRSFHVLYLHVLSHWTRHILRIIQKDGNLESGGYLIFVDDTNRIHGLRASMRTNVFLSCHGNYKPGFRHTIRRNNHSTMTLRRVFCGQSDVNPILRISLPFPVHNRRLGNNPFAFPPRKRSKKPHGTKKEIR